MTQSASEDGRASSSGVGELILQIDAVKCLQWRIMDLTRFSGEEHDEIRALHAAIESCADKAVTLISQTDTQVLEILHRGATQTQCN